MPQIALQRTPVFLIAVLLGYFFNWGCAVGRWRPTLASVHGYTLVWSDEFNGADGSSLDASKWTYDIGVGGNGWGNNELETYTNRTQNAHNQSGNLVITAPKETYAGTDSVNRNYTSAPLKTPRPFNPPYGRFEARIKIPAGQGMW